MRFKHFFRTRYTKEEKKFIDFAKDCALLKDLKPNELMVIYPHIHFRNYKNGEVVFFTDDSSMALYIIINGEVSLNIEHKNKLEQFLVLSQGDTVGDNSILNDHRRPYTAIIDSQEAVLGVIPSLAIKDIINNNSKIKIKVYNYLTRKYTKITSLIFTIYKESTFFEMGRLNEMMGKKKSSNNHIK